MGTYMLFYCYVVCSRVSNIHWKLTNVHRNGMFVFQHGANLAHALHLHFGGIPDESSELSSWFRSRILFVWRCFFHNDFPSAYGLPSVVTFLYVCRCLFLWCLCILIL